MVCYYFYYLQHLGCDNHTSQSYRNRKQHYNLQLTDVRRQGDFFSAAVFYICEYITKEREREIFKIVVTFLMVQALTYVGR